MENICAKTGASSRAAAAVFVYQFSREDAAGIDLPCLVIAGTESHPALRAIAAALARALPGARFADLAGSGHVTYAERPDQFTKAVAAFTAEISSPQRSQAAST